MDGKLVGIDIDNASNKVEMGKLILSKIPDKVEMARAYGHYVMAHKEEQKFARSKTD